MSMLTRFTVLVRGPLPPGGYKAGAAPKPPLLGKQNARARFSRGLDINADGDAT